MATARELSWPGTYGVRDLGGLPTRSGGETRRRSVLRSDGLDQLTGEGWEALHAHGVRTIVDLRSDWELSARPYRPLVDGVAVVEAGWEEGLQEDPDFAAWAAAGTLSCSLYYRPFLDRWPERTAAVVRAVATAGPGGVLFHCQRGRDRTGLLALLLLALADVPHAVIVADHLRTDELLTATGLDLGHEGTDGEADLFAARGTTNEATVRSLLADVDVAAHLRDAGLSADDLAALRTRLVDPGS